MQPFSEKMRGTWWWRVWHVLIAQQLSSLGISELLKCCRRRVDVCPHQARALPPTTANTRAIISITSQFFTVQTIFLNCFFKKLNITKQQNRYRLYPYENEPWFYCSTSVLTKVFGLLNTICTTIVLLQIPCNGIICCGYHDLVVIFVKPWYIFIRVML